MFPLLPIIQTAVLTLSLRTAADTMLADRLTPGELERSGVPREVLVLPTETQLVVPEGMAGIAVDTRDGTRYAAACYAYLKENGIFVRRFTVHVPDREGLPAARNVARFMALLWSGADRRFGTLNRRLRARPVDIWLTRTGLAGGEQIASSIYLYDIQADRSRIEWSRELAHEYGHYVLPGASGYLDPEPWSNGVLGERLFLRWLKQDLADKRVKPEMLPFAGTAEIADYCAKQPEPLIERIRSRSPNTALLRKRDEAAMDEFSALLLFAEATYGPKILADMLDYLPQGTPAGPTPEDFLSAVRTVVNMARRFETRVPGNTTTRLLLPKGRFRVSAGSPVKALALDRGVASTSAGDWTVTIPEAGWRAITLRGPKETVLRWERL